MPTSEKITAKANGIASNLERAVDNAGSNVHSTIDKVSDVARPAVEKITVGAHQAVEKIVGMASQAAGTVAEKSEQLHDIQQQLIHDCRTYVRQKPVASLGIAIGLGFLIGRFLRVR